MIISIIIPVYNVEEYLKECLDSVINQSFSDTEIICINNCSADDSLSILKEYALKDKRIKIINNDENYGAGIARNIGMKYAKGKYIFFLDSDDCLTQNALENLYNHAEQTQADITVTKAKAFTNDKSEKILQKIKQIQKYLNYDSNYKYNVASDNFSNAISDFNCCVWGKLFLKKFLDENNLEFIKKNIPYEDDGFWIKTCSSFPKMVFTEDVGLMYRIRESSVMAADTIKRRNKYLAVVVQDAMEYIKQNKQNAKQLIKKIKNSNAYSSLFGIKLGFLFRFLWAKDDKKIYLFGMDFFRQKIINRQEKITKILGISILKNRI